MKRAGIFDHRLLICLGPGGVGKTTVSAALALRAALEGRAVDVMTVDPAPRLLDLLTLDPSSRAPQNVALGGLARTGGGRLRALRLDPRHTFDGLVARYAPTTAAAEAILQNRIYRTLSSAMAGVGDYMAMEKLLELHNDESVERIVLDTPPARDALDLLDAPRRLLDLLDSRALTLLGSHGAMLRARPSIVDAAARAILSLFDRLTGLHLLADVRSFVEGFAGMYGGFAERAERAQSLLRAEDSMIVLVTTPDVERVAQTRDFIGALDGAGLRVGALVVNRVTPPPPEGAALARLEVDAALRRKLTCNLRDWIAIEKPKRAALTALRELLPAGASLVVVRDLGREPRSLKDLEEIGRPLRGTKD